MEDPVSSPGVFTFGCVYSSSTFSSVNEYVCLGLSVPISMYIYNPEIQESQEK